MSAHDHVPLVAKLEDLRTRLSEALAAPDDSARPVELDQTLQGRVSRIDAISQQQMARAGRARLAQQLARVEAALARERRGELGLCCRCGEEIAPARLQADPATPFCLNCAEIHDRTG